MNGKFITKVTVNEASEPDLFAYLQQFANDRLRAGAFRALARAALRGDRIGSVARTAQPVSAWPQALANEAPGMPGDAGEPVHTRPIDPLQPERARPIALPSVSGAPAAGRPFDTDAIGEQFADF